MRLSLYKIEKLVRRTSSLQIILSAITVHCVVSILMIYVHLSWFNSNDINREYLLSIENKNGGVILLENQEYNLLSNDIIDENDVSYIGWWNDHYKFNHDIVCQNSKGMICSKVFSSDCKIDAIRALYQYVPFVKQSEASSFEISLKLRPDQLQESPINGEQYLGILVLIYLQDGSREIIRIDFPPNADDWTKRSMKYSSPKNILIESISLMLLCYGYSGVVHFNDIRIIAFDVNNFKIKSANAIDYEANNSPQAKTKQLNYLIEDFSFFKTNENKINSNSQITLVTQVSIDRLGVLEKTLSPWTGPVSLVIYVPLKDFKNGLENWQKLYLSKKIKSLKLNVASSVKIVLDNESSIDYPINYMRNIGILNVKTKYFLLIDADFQVSPELETRFISMISKRVYSYNRIAFILPTFEYIEQPRKDDAIPKTKEELLQLIFNEQQQLVQPFRINESGASHKLTNYLRWYVTNTMYRMAIYSDKYEPYMILEKNDDLPMFDETFTGYGMNKVTYFTELYAAKYEFVVMPNIWLIHLPHKISKFNQNFQQKPESKLLNRFLRFQFIHNLRNKYLI